MLLRARDGLRGTFIDTPSGRVIRKVVWADTDTGQYEALQLDPAGNVQRSAAGIALVYRGRAVGQLKFVPAVMVNKKRPIAAHEVDPQEPLPPLLQRAERLSVPLLANRCEHYGCERVANWAVADEVPLPPVLADNRLWKRGKTVGQHYYCDKHFQPPRILDHRGEVMEVLSASCGERPGWHSS